MSDIEKQNTTDQDDAVVAVTGLTANSTSTSTPTPTITAVPTVNRNATDNEGKLGGKCCGCCCDYRRAVIIVNAVGIALGLLGLVLSFGLSGSGFIFVILDIIFSIVAIVGAIQYNVIMVGLTVAWLVIQFVHTVVVVIIVGGTVLDIVLSVVITALFIYPHVGFIREVKSGVMSRETYPREEFSCCCATERRAQNNGE